MKKKGKILSALCMAVLLGFLVPVSTMRAAEGYVDAGQDTPVIEIMYQGQNLTQSLEGTIEYHTYIGNGDQCLNISVGHGANPASLSYYLDSSGSSESMDEEQLGGLWQEAQEPYYQSVALREDGKYVLYVKAADEEGREVCARTFGIVVDTLPPVISGIEEGSAYPLGTKFYVEDDNLDTVLVNEQEVFPSAEDGSYQIAANGTSCVVRVKDKAGHEKTCSITVAGEAGGPGDGGSEDDTPEDDKPQEDIMAITASGTYSLKAGTAYRLGKGNWTLEGDSAVYSGDVTFYVDKDADYNFTAIQNPGE